MHILARNSNTVSGASSLRPYRWMRLAAVLLLLTGLARTGYAADGPLNQLRTTIDAVLEVVRVQDLELAIKHENISSIIAGRFDFPRMAQSTLATNWKKATPEEKKRFIELYTRLLHSTYMAHIEGYTDESVEYRNESIKKRRAIVQTVIISNGIETPVDYKLHEKTTDGTWWVYDVVIEGVSLVSTYRAEYQSIVHSSGIPGLLEQLENKLQVEAPVSTT
ncbi:MAG: ABC transporter substrate-binding protein [Thiogranum sp.]|nr:ABC transporter substrate-binding protein [Thiogranum sp.]